MRSPGGELNSYRLITREAEAGVGAAGRLPVRALTCIFVIHYLPVLTPVFHRYAHGSPHEKCQQAIKQASCTFRGRCARSRLPGGRIAIS